MLKVYTAGETFVFEGSDEKAVYDAVGNGGIRGSEWTNPIQLSSGKKITFMLNNIIAVECD